MNKTPAIIVAIIAIIVLCCCSLCALLWTAYSLQRTYDLYPHDAAYQDVEPFELGIDDEADFMFDEGGA